MNSGNRSGSCSENCGFRIAQVVRRHSENGFPELQELLREYPGTLPELLEWPCNSESVFHEIGVVPRLLILNSLHGYIPLGALDPVCPRLLA